MYIVFYLTKIRYSIISDVWPACLGSGSSTLHSLLSTLVQNRLNFSLRLLSCKGHIKTARSSLLKSPGTFSIGCEKGATYGSSTWAQHHPVCAASTDCTTLLLPALITEKETVNWVVQRWLKKKDWCVIVFGMGWEQRGELGVNSSTLPTASI